MPDLTSISIVLSSLKTATDLAKAVKDSHTSLEQAEINYKIAELVSALADARVQVADIQTEILSKDAEIRNLEEASALKESMVWEKPYYWRMVNEEKDGPYCQKCYDSDRKLIRLQGGGKNYWICTVCKSKFTDSDYVKPKARQYRNYSNSRTR